MTTTEKINKLIKMSPFHSAIIASMIIQKSKELLADEAKFLEENKNNVISPETIISIAKDAIEKLR
jgi:hypothetical protein